MISDDERLDAPILVLHEAPDDRARLMAVLRAAGYRKIVGEGDPRQVEQQCSRLRYAAILLDVPPAALAASGLLASLSGIYAGEYLPALVLTGDADEATLESLFDGGAKDVLRKPFHGRELLHRLRNILDARLLSTRLTAQGLEIDARMRERAADLAASEERYALAVAAANDALFDWDLPSGRIYFADRWLAFLGLSPSEMGDTPEAWFSRVHPDDLIWLEATLDAQAGQGGRPFQIEYRIAHSSGEYRWMSCRGIEVVNDAGVPVRIVGSQSDITDRKRAETALRESEERYARAAQGANDGLFDWDIVRNEAYFSERWSTIMGWQPNAATGRIGDLLDCVIDEDRAGLDGAIAAHIGGGTEHLEHEFRVRHGDGGERWMIVRGLAVRDEMGAASRLAGSIRDITVRRRMQNELTHRALHDELTDLPNRALFLDRLGGVLSRRPADGTVGFIVGVLALDRFKAISDGLGPRLADQVLVEVAARLQRAYRQGDTVARVGEDQFGLLLDGITDNESAVREGARIDKVLAEPIRVGEHELIVTASIGIVTADPDRSRDAEEMLRDAGLALFRAKSDGRRVAMFDSKLHERAMQALELETALRGAVDRGELCMFYQPLISLETETLAGFEALMRWRRPGHGLVSPMQFIPVAEETGLIVPMGRRGLIESVAQLAAWTAGRPAGHPLMMSVNVSARQFRDDDLVGLVREVLAEYPIQPASLKLEVTESVLSDEPEKLARTLQQLRELGVKISLDDFGTGYSSLSYLHQFPFDVLKIDRTFIRRASGRQAEIARAIGLLGRALNLDIVAEGIEDAADADFARSLGSHFGQGYLWGRPLPVEEIVIPDA